MASCILAWKAQASAHDFSLMQLMQQVQVYLACITGERVCQEGTCRQDPHPDHGPPAQEDARHDGKAEGAGEAAGQPAAGVWHGPAGVPPTCWCVPGLRACMSSGPSHIMPYSYPYHAFVLKTALRVHEPFVAVIWPISVMDDGSLPVQETKQRYLWLQLSS